MAIMQDLLVFVSDVVFMMGLVQLLLTFAKDVVSNMRIDAASFTF
ncbi:hypothetical protein [Cytobacillus firmus]|nr:hypothetical protein [Cytobacillus firmus]